MVDEPKIEDSALRSDSALSPEQADTAKLLDRVLGKSIADRYVDFCRLSAGFFALRVSSPIAAHALRELDSIMRQALAAPMGAKIEAPLSSEQRKQARKALRALSFDDPAVDRAINELAPKITHNEQIKRIVVRLGLPEDGDLAKAWISVTGAAKKKVHERRFDRALQVDDEFRAEWAKPFDNVVRGVAVALQSNYALLMKRVETLAAMADKKKAIEAYEQEIPGALPLQWHFFQSLKDTEWLPFLVENDLIVEPQPRSADSEGGVRFRDWPVGSYLRSMAKTGDENTRALVTKALRTLQNTENGDVRRDGIEIIAALPVEEAVHMIDVVEAWLSRESFFIGLNHAENLLFALAEAGQRDAALRLAKALLRLFERNGEVGTLYSRHMYEHSLPKTAEILIKLIGLDALRLLADLLYQAAVLSDKIRNDPPADYTSVILEPLTRTDPAYDVYGALVKAIRVSAEYLIAQPGADGAAIVGVLRRYDYKIFRRLALYALARNPSAARQLAESYLFDTVYIDALNFRFEYGELATAVFPTLSEDRQVELLSLIDDLPQKHAQNWRKNFFEYHKREPNEADEKTYKSAVIRDATWNWRSVLPQQRQEALTAIVAEIGDPDAWKFKFDNEPDTSPMTASDFSVKSVEEIAGYLRSWSPGTNSKETKTALGMELYKAAQSDPKKFAAGAFSFEGVAPLYVRRLFEGLHNVVQNKAEIDWGPILRLLETIIARVEPDKPGELSSGGDDPSWFWAAKEGAQLVRTGLMFGREGIPFANAQAVAHVVIGLTTAAPSTVEIDNFEELNRQTPYFAAENTMLGLATELRVLEIFWLSKQEQSAIFAKPREAIESLPGFDEFVRGVLKESGINGRIVRAIFGRYLSWLTYFGLSWVKSNIQSLFPPNATELRDAAWLAHLINDQGPIADLMVEMSPSYRAEIDRLLEKKSDSEKDWRENRLGEYIIIQYLWGKLPEELFNAFGENAPASLRRHVMWFIGRDLKRSPEEMPSDVRARALAYWDLRLSVAERAADKDRFREELGSFASWLQNSSLDTQWLIDQQLRMLRAGFAPKEAYAVVNWAAEVAKDFPDGAVAVIEALFNNPTIEQWAYMGQQPQVRSVFEAGLASENVDTHRAVERTIGVLASHGEASFLDLVKSS